MKILNLFIDESIKEIIKMIYENEGLPAAALSVAVIVLFFIIVAAIYLLIFSLLMKLRKRIFKKLEEKHGNSLTIQFMEKVVALILIIIFVVVPLGGDTLAQSLLGSTTVIAAVVGLAANDVIKDMFAGLQISIYKPFDVGSRIKLEDGRNGIVEKMTLGHVVLKLIDSTRLVIPNSKANTMIIVNYSYHEDVPRAFDARFSIGYDSDIDKAKEVIRRVICDSPLTLNEYKFNEADPGTKDVYFLEIQDSALVLGATVKYADNFRTEVVIDEINTKVFKALVENNIEVPYNYMNLLVRDGSSDTVKA